MPASPAGRPRRNSWALLSATAQDATASWWNAQFLLVKFVKSSCLVKLPQLNCQSHPLSWVSNLWLKTWILRWKLPPPRAMLPLEPANLAAMMGQSALKQGHPEPLRHRNFHGTSMRWVTYRSRMSECLKFLNDIKSRLRVPHGPTMFHPFGLKFIS